MEVIAGKFLQNINNPDDLKKLNQHELQQVCNELRQYIIDVVSMYGGHFAASLGVVELTVALHYVYNTPYDNVIWDVGHQAYGHKILTERRKIFTTNRKYKGLSGFPKRSESDYDAFGTGHSSTSISAALGMAIAAKYKHENRKSIAVIGDGSLTAGMAFEALNHAGVANADILVILNDNHISIDPNVGALQKYLTELTNSKHTNNNLFEALNFTYIGVVDGHNIIEMVKTLQELKNIDGPKLLHITTVKGKGYAQAEKEQTLWHSPGLFDKITGEIYKKTYTTPQPPKYQDVFGYTMIELAEMNDAIMGITPAMPSGSSLKFMMDKMPHRAFDVGICEQHAVTLSAGLATQGIKVFCNIYSTFMQRAYDQVIHDVAIQNLPITFCLDRAGLVGEDGATHHGCYDIAFFRCIPNMIVAAPMNEQELRNLMFTSQLATTKNPFVIRYPRGEGVMPEWKTPFEEIIIGKGRKLHDGNEIAFLTLGHVGNFVQKAIQQLREENIFPAHFDMRFVKPLDETLLHEVCSKYKKIITVEDGSVKGGFGSAITEFMAEHHYTHQIKILGIPDKVIEQGSLKELYQECEYDIQSIQSITKSMMS
ncbi:MAG: 1-deoxy-D-xylulose-5-phosphate synthase [Chitinophagaceae bacterium]|nr:1-deoxy-D-xylulose-5-phosphate synthase [Chitinophagaceae bacterium]MCW5904960.1 1-deoxy-D-xylulose-5-phosphate synthase [Chitinophagaceae bacterium]